MPSQMELVLNLALLRKQSDDNTGLVSEPGKRFTHGTGHQDRGRTEGGVEVDMPNDWVVDPNSTGKSVKDMPKGGDPRIKPDLGLLEQGTVGPDGKIKQPAQGVTPVAKKPLVLPPMPASPGAPQDGTATPVSKPVENATGTWRTPSSGGWK